MNLPSLAKIAPFSPIESTAVRIPDFKSSLRPDTIASSVGLDIPARSLNSARLGFTMSGLALAAFLSASPLVSTAMRSLIDFKSMVIS